MGNQDGSLPGVGVLSRQSLLEYVHDVERTSIKPGASSSSDDETVPGQPHGMTDSKVSLLAYNTAHIIPEQGHAESDSPAWHSLDGGDEPDAGVSAYPLQDLFKQVAQDAISDGLPCEDRAGKPSECQDSHLILLPEMQLGATGSLHQDGADTPQMQEPAPVQEEVAAIKRRLSSTALQARNPFEIFSASRAGRTLAAKQMEHSVQRLHLGHAPGHANARPSRADMDEYVRMQRERLVGGKTPMSVAQVAKLVARLTATAEPETRRERPKSVRVRHVRNESGQWVDTLLPALELSPKRQIEVMTAMYTRGRDDAVRREAALAGRYLTPLGTFGKVLYRAKAHTRMEGGGRRPSATKDMVRLTPPIKGTHVYPGDSWQLPG